MRAGVHLLAAGRLKRGLRYLVEPVCYWRTMEYQLVWNSAGFNREDRVLDIGSPKLLSLYLAERVGAEVHASDIEDYFVNEFGLLRRARNIPTATLHLDVEDGRRLSYPDNSFSKVYSISTIEHIPDNGDSACVREIGRVLRPGGMCLITTPYWPTSRDEYQRPNFYWAGSSTTAPDGRVFYQRRYSEKDLFDRLIKPSGLSLTKLEYVGERPLVPAHRELDNFLVPATGPLHPAISRVMHIGPTASLRDLKRPLCAFLVLTKR
jgi:SAM-dependent methyltransferase